MYGMPRRVAPVYILFALSLSVRVGVSSNITLQFTDYYAYNNGRYDCPLFTAATVSGELSMESPLYVIACLLKCI